jgi:GT2 family glycosyltransferase
MPGSTAFGYRTWVGIARCGDEGITIEGVVEPWSGTHDRARILVVDDRGPVDWLTLDPEEDFEEAIAKLLARSGPTDERLPLPGLPDGDLSIAICTRDRPDLLRSCLERVCVAAGDRYEVVVVDNAPQSDASALVVEDFARRGHAVRRIVEPQPGLSRARNRALAEIDTDYVAFTDDDALADRLWPGELHRGFSTGSGVAVVTGIVPSAQIETETQALFERKIYKWSNKLEPQSVRMKRDGGTFAYPTSTGDLGTGANFAVDRRIVLGLGGFDEALGAGSLSRGGEDSEMFVRVLRAGHELRYQPSAIVWHLHAVDPRELRKIVFGYGKGISAMTCSEFLQPGKAAMLRGTLRGAGHLARDRRSDVELGTPRSHLLLELAGVACGPFAYAIERVRKRG